MYAGHMCVFHVLHHLLCELRARGLYCVRVVYSSRALCVKKVCAFFFFRFFFSGSHKQDPCACLLSRWMFQKHNPAIQLTFVSGICVCGDFFFLWYMVHPSGNVRFPHVHKFSVAVIEGTQNTQRVTIGC